MTIFWVALVTTVTVGLGTYLIRSSFIVLLSGREMPPSVAGALQYVAPAVLAALVVSLLLGGEAEAGWVEVSALVTGGVAGWRTKSLIWVLVVGMVTLWVLSALV